MIAIYLQSQARIFIPPMTGSSIGRLPVFRLAVRVRQHGSVVFLLRLDTFISFSGCPPIQ